MPESTEEFTQSVSKVFVDMRDLLARKRQAYGSENIKQFGTMGILVRTNDKIWRLKHMYEKGTQRDAGDGEGELDAWRDILGYATLAILLIEEQRKETPGELPHGTPDIDFDYRDTPEYRVIHPERVSHQDQEGTEYQRHARAVAGSTEAGHR